MSLPAYKEPLFGPAAYLDWEAEQSEKHEYLNGEVFNMAGASEAHVTIALNVAMALRQHLQGAGFASFVLTMLLGCAISAALAWGKVARLFAFRALAEDAHNRR